MNAPAGATGGATTPPSIPGSGPDARHPEECSAVSLCVLRKRADFLKAAGARRQGTDGFLLQARDRADGDARARVGFTASKKIGNAVARNRAKRRLRALARDILCLRARPGWDYVLVARPQATLSSPFAALRSDFERAIQAVHRVRA